MARSGDGIYERSRTWWLDFTHRGERHVVRIGSNISKTVAKEIAQVERGKILRGESGIGKKRADIGFKEAKKRFLAWRESNRLPTEFYTKCLARLEKHFGDKTLGRITSASIESYKQARAEGTRGVTANRELTALSRLFNWCRDQRPPLYEGENPATRKNVKRFEESEGRIRFLEWEEEARLLAAAKEPLRTILLCGTDAGLRLDREALTLRWSGLDFRRGLVTVEAAFSKNGKLRSIPMTDRLREALIQHRFRSKKQKPEAHVFTSRKGEPFRSIRTIFETARKSAGLGEDVTPHVCRHTFGSRLAMAGKDVRTIQELMGHKRIEMTIRYTHVSDEHKAAAVRTALVPPARIPQPFSQQGVGQGEAASG